MSNLERIIEGLPIVKQQLESCNLNLDEIKCIENPLSMLVKYPYQSQWKYDVWEWLSYQLALSQGNNYLETGDIKAFTAKNAYSIATK